MLEFGAHQYDVEEAGIPVYLLGNLPNLFETSLLVNMNRSRVVCEDF
jgi:hypothetical protein